MRECLITGQTPCPHLRYCARTIPTRWVYERQRTQSQWSQTPAFNVVKLTPRISDPNLGVKSGTIVFTRNGLGSSRVGPGVRD